MPLDHLTAFSQVRDRIAAASARCGRNADGVTIVGVTKGHSQEILSKVRALKLADIGENRVQEALEKYGHGELVSIANARRLHLIGHLQTNKVKKAAELFDCLDTVDSADLANQVSKSSAALGRRPRLLMQVNTSRESQKSGVPPERAAELAGRLADLENIDFKGLMTIGPLEGDEAAIRASFDLLRNLRDKIEQEFRGLCLPVLSMGMSDDFEWAIEAGATEIRLGTILWGARTT